ncbi:NnrU family protein [Methylocaldum sp.]|uniref:NnrU family protein n=1 Tax=Methylocaldum sp. TaxID=1969727 RepID=UPI002D5AC873|nr:NnrU family protein [Methylocaldum sp.]HYE37011.1 NnrU family protein [Methylocaldum sp.]
MIQLTLAALFFIGIHFLIAGTRWRDRLVARYGERVYRIGFSSLSVLGLFWLIYAYRHAPYIETWGQLAWFKPVAALLMLVAFILAVTGVTTLNPTAVNGESRLYEAEPARGILRVTRHPFLWGVGLWAIVHLIANGDAAALVLFGSLLLLTIGGTRSIDAKRQRRFGEQWAKFTAVTSNIPFNAIREGRNQLKLAEIGWWRIALALLLYLGMMHFHTQLFGVSPLF